MPATSRSQQRLFQAAEHGATFPKAQQIRATVAPGTIRDFAVGSEQGKPQRVKGSRHPHQNLGKYLHPRKAR